MTISTGAFATDGYFSHGFGVKSQATGGIGIALPQDSLAAATNPAGTVLVGDRVDAGVSWFAPRRGADITGNGAPGANGSYDGNDTGNFFIPEIAYTRQLSAAAAVGIAVYGNGGMNTDYSKNPFGAFGSKGRAGINLEQLFVSPSFAYKLNDQNAIGISANFAYQRFSANGLSVFSSNSIDAANLTDRGTDASNGWGFHLGWNGQITPELSLGATWASKVKTGNFEKYRGLFADQGGFDIPENYGLGIAFKPAPGLTLAADVQRIKFAGVKSIANPLANLFAGNPLGSANGPGFGWRDITVVKVGAIYEYNKALDLRAGYNHGGQAVQSDQTFFNILAPGVVQDHLTFGATFKNTPNTEISFSYSHGFKKTINGVNSIPAPFGGGNANVSLSENIVGIAFAWKL
ncbi:OmpP1/FadL family transporter [Undibacterium hunanense]|nr:outer membrane protein transport protein [Undibacterium hunanense]